MSGAPGAQGSPETGGAAPARPAGRVPKQRAGEAALSGPAEPAEAPEPGPPGGCQTNRAGWAGGHRHGAVRPRPRPTRRQRPPGRWC
nr:hypothetical protein [Micromonospora sp. DSM 115978]